MDEELTDLLLLGQLSQNGGSDVCILHGDQPSDRIHQLSAWLRGLDPDARVVTSRVDAEGQPPVVKLAASARFDLVLDISVAPGWRRRIKTLVPLVRARGCVVSERAEPGDGARSFLQRLSTNDPGRPRLADVIGSTSLGANWLRVDVAHNSLIKVFEHEVDSLRGHSKVNDAAVVVPAEPWVSRGVTRGNDEVRAASLPTTFAGFDLRLHTYNEVWCLLQSAVVADGIALPESFRRSYAGIYSNAQLESLTQRAALPPPRPERRLAGTYLHLDNEWRGQFGHNLLEQVSKTWAWSEAVARHPDVLALVTARRHVPVAEWELQLLHAAGIPRSRITVAREPVVVERLLTATGGYYLPDRAHPALVDLYGRMAQRLSTSPDPGRSYPGRLFFSRKPGRRRGCMNGERVEAVFSDHGFEVVYPEDHSLATQMSMVRACTTFAGFAGSGMYHLALTAGGPPKQVIAITARTYVEYVESVFSALYGHELWMVWCDDVIINDRSVVQSDYRFGPDDEIYLREVLNGLYGNSAHPSAE
ncbi:glycosyltransferase family 61 protein [Nocardioides rubriscoriae]|uniref:glycosyltransferase family 61 protein n=1 Tax=Nocardioides rubriscoriae TaxID=642762 RepID=UPI0014794745|nr:glycosyltransferase 61 family protein [Nocardioides rubriscoriae]